MPEVHEDNFQDNERDSSYIDSSQHYEASRRAKLSRAEKRSNREKANNSVVLDRNSDVELEVAGPELPFGGQS